MYKLWGKEPGREKAPAGLSKKRRCRIFEENAARCVARTGPARGPVRTLPGRDVFFPMHMSSEKTDFSFFAACAPRTALAKRRRKRRLPACIAPAGADLRGFLISWREKAPVSCSEQVRENGR
jgi:hypothetical protein